jgi:hypothetical protein
MKYRVTGVDLPFIGGGLSWEKTQTDADLARQIVECFEDRRVLFGLRIFEDVQYSLQSANECRQYLTQLLQDPTLGEELRSLVKAVRASFRRFVDEAGPGGVFLSGESTRGLDLFSVALGELRATVGLHLATIAYQYEIEVEEELATIFPSMDVE